MGKLPVLSGSEVCAILERHGFRQVRRRGSHIVMQRVTDEGTTTVPVPDHRELSCRDIAIDHSAVWRTAERIRDLTWPNE